MPRKNSLLWRPLLANEHPRSAQALLPTGARSNQRSELASCMLSAYRAGGVPLMFQASEHAGDLGGLSALTLGAASGWPLTSGTG